DMPHPQHRIRLVLRLVLHSLHPLIGDDRRDHLPLRGTEDVILDIDQTVVLVLRLRRLNLNSHFLLPFGLGQATAPIARSRFTSTSPSIGAPAHRFPIAHSVNASATLSSGTATSGYR